MREFLLMLVLILGVGVHGETNEVSRVQLLDASARAQCEARTKSGTQCKRKALPGDNLCRQHKKIAEKKPERARLK